MSEEKKQNDKEKKDVLHVNEGDEINVSDIIDVQPSDITVTAQRIDEIQSIIVPRAVISSGTNLGEQIWEQIWGHHTYFSLSSGTSRGTVNFSLSTLGTSWALYLVKREE